MRIIGGALRGRKLAHVGKGDAAAHLRPTSDRVRESLFNILQSGYGDRLDGARVLDVFAGTGALGLEALSRGAALVTFIEQGRPALKLLRENIRICGAGAETSIIPRDARKPGTAAQTFDFIFLDPPYGKALGEQALGALINLGWIEDGAIVVWEEGGSIILPPALGRLDERRYGDTVIGIFEVRF